MIYFLVDPADGDNLVKIGYSSSPEGVIKRFRDHRGSNTRFEFYCAIEGDKHHERLLHEHFAAARVDGRGNNETFRLTPELKDYLEWLGEQPFVACSLEEVSDPFAHYEVDVMWPNQAYRSSTSLLVSRQSLFWQTIGEVRAPLPAKERMSYAIRDTNEWYTPATYVEAARRTMGSIDLDPASSPFANQTVRAARIYTRRDDGLAASNLWEGNIWLNPPYGGMQVAFIKRLMDEHRSGAVPQAVLCVNGYRYDTKWFQDLFEFPICWSARRIAFLGGASANGAKTEENNNPSNGTVFVYMGNNVEGFGEEFSRFGNVQQSLRRYRDAA